MPSFGLTMVPIMRLPLDASQPKMRHRSMVLIMRSLLCLGEWQVALRPVACGTVVVPTLLWEVAARNGPRGGVSHAGLSKEGAVLEE